MENRRQRRNRSPNLLLIILPALVLLVGSAVLLHRMGHKSSNPESTSSVSEAVSEVLPSEEVEEEPEVLSEPSSDTAQESRIYTDERVPNYTASNPVWETIHFVWDSQDKRGTLQLDLPIDREMYNYYRGLGRYYGMDEYQYYINDSNNQEIVAEIVQAIQENAGTGTYSDAAIVREIAKFVQDTIEYQYDIDTTGEEEYPRYPIETLYEQQGDCEDTSILMAALLKELGYEVGLLDLPGHLAVGLRTADDYSGGDYYEFNGHRYLYIESTGSGWNIGDIPDDVMGQEATLYIIP